MKKEYPAKIWVIEHGGKFIFTADENDVEVAIKLGNRIQCYEKAKEL